MDDIKDPANNISGNANSKDAVPRRRNPDPGIIIQEYIEGSSSPEETLFKINEILFADEIENTRKYVRAPLTIPVVFLVNGKTYTGATYTLSQRGMFIKHPSPPCSGETIPLAFEIPDEGGEIEVKAEVRNSFSIEEATEQGVLSGMSVVFKNISGKDRRRIDKLVKKLARQMKKPNR